MLKLIHRPQRSATQQPNTGYNMILDMQKHKYHSKLHVKAYDLKKKLDEHTLEMHCICRMIQQVPLDDTFTSGCEFGADRTSKHRWRHGRALQPVAFLNYRRVHLEEKDIYIYSI